MGRPKKTPRTTSVRLTEDVARWARIAAAYNGESITDYVNRVLAGVAEADAKRGAVDLGADDSASKKPKRPKGAE